MPRKSNRAVKKLFVLDTNILLHDPHAFFSFQEHDVLIPMTVLEELDHIKDRNKDVSRDARVAIRSLENTLQDVEPEEMIEGVPLNRGDLKDSSVTGHLIILNDHHIASEVSGLPGGENDNRIINAALHLQKERPKVTVVLVTKDINMRLKAKGAGLKHVEDYTTDQLIDDISFLTKGYEVVPGEFWQQVTSVECDKDGRDVTHSIETTKFQNTFINEYLLDEGEHFAGKVVENINKVQSEYPTIFNFTQSGGQEKTSVAVPAELVVKKPKKAAEKKPRAAAKKAPAKGKAAAGKAAAKPAAKTAKAKTAAKPAAKAAAKPAAKAALKAKPAAAAKTEAQSQLVIPQVEKTNGASSNSPMSPATPPAKS